MSKKLCIVVPYRNREEHLSEFIPYIRKFLSERSIDYFIVVVEQADTKPFNRAKLLNIGFEYTKGRFDYYCFHDVDMLPMDDADYSYCNIPTHLAAKAEQFNWGLPFIEAQGKFYFDYFGGVTLFDRGSFLSINGYSNEYFGWGEEDCDVRRRLEKMEIKWERRGCSFSSLPHPKFSGSAEYQKNLQRSSEFEKYFVSGKFIDGLSTLSYKFIQNLIDEIDYKMIKVEL